MKIIFLDIDGVLNSRRFFRQRILDETLQQSEIPWWTEMLDEVAVWHLNGLVDRTAAKIVISSSWRIATTIPFLEKIFEAVGLKAEIIGVTPVIRHYWPDRRGWEILNWIQSSNVQIDSFVILDDKNDMGELKGRLVQTSKEDGLQSLHVDVACEHLDPSP